MVILVFDFITIFTRVDCVTVADKWLGGKFICHVAVAGTNMRGYSQQSLMYDDHSVLQECDSVILRLIDSKAEAGFC